MKRLGALLLVLVLTMSVMPMGALATNDASNTFMGWYASGSFASLTHKADGVNGTSWSDITATDVSSFSGGVLIYKALSLNDSMDLTASPGWYSEGGGTTLIVNNANLELASTTAAQRVTAGNVYTLGAGKILLNGHENNALHTNNGSFMGTMTIARKPVNGDAITDKSAAWSPVGPVKDTIDVTETSSIIDYTQPAGSQFTVDASGKILTLSDVTFNGKATFTALSTVTGAFTVGKTGVVDVNAAATFTGAIEVNGTMNINGASTFSDATSGITVKSGGTLNINVVTTGASFTNITVETGGKLNVIKNAGARATFPEITVEGGTMDVTGDATFTAIDLESGKLTVNASPLGASFGNITVNGGTLDFLENAEDANATLGNITLNGGTMNINGELGASFTSIAIDGGILNIWNSTDLETDQITLTTGIMNVNVDTTIINDDFTVAAGGTLKVKDGVTLDLGSVNLIVEGKADFGTGGKLDGNGAGKVTVTGALYMKDPAVQVNTTTIKGSNFRGNGTIYTDHRTWFIRGYADPDLKYVGYSPLAISYGESILVNTPVLAPATSNYSGYGDFIINTSGLFSNFDPNESLYANNQKLQVGVDYEVNDKGGYAIFTIYESFMQSQSGPIVFRATFKNGYSGSTTVNAQSATIPAEIGVDAPKTGMSASVMGFVVIAMAIALAVVVRKVKA